jgi:hypothetical protein
MRGTVLATWVLGMKHRAWLVLSLAAYFGLSTPLCTYVCLIEAGGTHTTTSTHGSHGSHHFNDEHSDAPRDDRPLDHEWDCDEISEGLLATVERPRPTPSFAWVVPVISRHRASPQIAKLPFAKPEQASLPPPDILLLKSTLLI